MQRLVILLLCFVATTVGAVPFWGSRESSPADLSPTDLKPGEWIWGGDNKAMGPMAVIVSLTEQRAYVYRNGILIAVSTVSSGKKGHETPTGVFTILQKDKDHHSKKYDNAPMPYQERLTWDGIALHAGGLPGYPESHGCVHLPTKFAELLFGATNMGMTVVIAEEGSSPVAVVHPRPILPIDPHTGAETNIPPLEDGEAYRWQPDAAPDGPISMVLSRSDARIIVYRNGLPGEQAARLKIAGGIATSFGCTISGVVPEARVLEIAAKYLEMGADELIIAVRVCESDEQQESAADPAEHTLIDADLGASNALHENSHVIGGRSRWIRRVT